MEDYDPTEYESDGDEEMNIEYDPETSDYAANLQQQIAIEFGLPVSQIYN